MRPFVHLHTHTPFSFLDGGSSVDALIEQAALDGQPALAITDHDNLSCVVRFQKKALQAGIKPILGVELTVDGHHLTLLAQNGKGYSNLARLVTRAHLENPRREPCARTEDLAELSENIICLSGCRKGRLAQLLLRGHRDEALRTARELRSVFQDRFYLEVQNDLLPGTRLLLRQLADLGEELAVPLVATNNVHYAKKEDFQVHDLLTCVRTLTTVSDIHPARRLNAENYLKTSDELQRLFRSYPGAYQNALHIAEQCEPGLDLETRHFPQFELPAGYTARSLLRELVYRGAQEKYGTVSRKLRERLEHELDMIASMELEEYFLLVWDVARHARENSIRYAGRGSAADSVVTYCLDITEVDAFERGLLFERFMSPGRTELPDIDIDFDARYRDDVAEYVYEKYGEDHVTSVATYYTFKARSAIRDLGKALEFDPGELDRLAKRLPHIHADAIYSALERIPEVQNAELPVERYQLLFDSAARIAGFPRHLGTHLGGLVISSHPLTQFTPLQEAAKGVTISQFDKDDVEDLGLLKLDLLSLRMMSAIEDTVVRINAEDSFSYDDIPLDDRATYEMLNRGDNIGTFQLESPAQRSLHSYLGADNLEDIIASVALIRPGPIKGNMVEPFVARRRGEEPITYLHPALEPILRHTYGVVLFQEQVIELAVAVADFDPAEADQLRRAMTHARSHRAMKDIGEQFIARAQRNGVSRDVAQQIFMYIAGYASYGFCEAHAAAFGTTAYKSAYLLRHFPAELYASILNHEPMGYYPANTIVLEARRRGIPVLGPSINKSKPEVTVVPLDEACRRELRRSQVGTGRSMGLFIPEEFQPLVQHPRKALRIGLKYVRGISGEALSCIENAREDGPFRSLADFCRRTRIPYNVRENLVLAGALDEFDVNRRRLLWQLSELRDRGTMGTASTEAEPGLRLDEVWEAAPIDGGELGSSSPWQRMIDELGVLGIAVTAHPLLFLRSHLQELGCLRSDDLRQVPPGTMVRAGGLVLVPHRPPTRSGRTVVFFSLEDECGLIEATLFEKIYRRYGHLVFQNPRPPLMVEGRLDRRGKGFNIIVERIQQLEENKP